MAALKKDICAHFIVKRIREALLIQKLQFWVKVRGFVCFLIQLRQWQSVEQLLHPRQLHWTVANTKHVRGPPHRLPAHLLAWYTHTVWSVLMAPVCHNEKWMRVSVLPLCKCIRLKWENHKRWWQIQSWIDGGDNRVLQRGKTTFSRCNPNKNMPGLNIQLIF